MICRRTIKVSVRLTCALNKCPENRLKNELFQDGGIYDYQIKKVETQIQQYMMGLSSIRFNKIGRLGPNNQIISFPQVDSSPFDTPEAYYTAKIRTTLSDNVLHHIDENPLPLLMG
jgi:hypothetical protein